MASDRVVLKKGYKPKKSEKYMSERQQEYFRQKLLSWREELVEESRETIRSFRSGFMASGFRGQCRLNGTPAGLQPRILPGDPSLQQEVAASA